MTKYVYNGPVMEFGKCVSEHWQASTLAVSEKKARSNLAYRFKKEFGKCSTAKITLPGKIMVEGENSHERV